MPPILFPGKLPAGALVEPGLPTAKPKPRTQPVAGPPAPLWFSTRQPDRLEFNRTGRVTAWTACAPATASARAVGFNDTGTGWDAEARALDFTEKTHGGLCVDAALPRGDRFSVGLIYLPPPKRDAQTLLSLQAKGADDYLFLSAENDFVRFGIKGGDQSLTAPDPQRLTLVVLSSDGQNVRMAINRDVSVSLDCALPAAPLDLFIGCRGGSRSLLGKLGSFKLTDVLVWPGDDVLAGVVSRAPEAALNLWQERLRDGIQA